MRGVSPFSPSFFLLFPSAFLLLTSCAFAVPSPHQTKRAAGQIKEIMEDEPGMVGLRISVRTRGCSGNAFHLEYATEKNKFDEEIDAYVRGNLFALAAPLISLSR